MSMSKSEREDFLAQVHVGILAIAGDEGAGPLAVPIWYSYQPGGALSLTTGPGTRKARAIAAAGRFSLCVQDDQPPYQYVTVEGAAVIEPASRADRLSIAQRDSSSGWVPHFFAHLAREVGIFSQTSALTTAVPHSYSDCAPEIPTRQPSHRSTWRLACPLHVPPWSLRESEPEQDRLDRPA